jgi:CRP/FNR family transcriptional regulator, anaerobic regulatory protein
MILRGETVDILKDFFPVWNKIDEKQQEELKKSALIKKFDKGTSLHNVVGNCSGLFIVTSGQIRVFIISETGKEITLYRLFDRDACLFSAACMMNNIQFDICIEAEKPTETILIPSPIYKRLSDESLSISNFNNQLMASRFSEVMWLIEQISFTSMDKRLAAYLLEQSAIYDSTTINLTHENIANDLGTAREVISRMLKYFQNEGLVSVFRGGVSILNMDKLQNFSHNTNK